MLNYERSNIMNLFKKIYCRTYQFCFRVALPFLPYRQPEILKTNDDVVNTLKSKNLSRVFLVTDKTLRSLGLTAPLEKALANGGMEVTVFDEVLPNPTISLVEKGVEKYLENSCDSIIALGGGSVIDCAKTVGARIVKPNMTVKQMKGLLKIRKRLPLLIAIPTTAGTGSETTLASVITDDETHHKYPINDFSLIPHYALLDYHLTLGLNKQITSTTGMDALTHAVESYIGQSTTKGTRRASVDAVRLIKDNLVTAFDDGQNATARQNMLQASYLAGVSFTKSYVGYVHAIAHSLGGKYGVPHGLANAILLPIVLKHYGKSAYGKLSKLAKLTGIASTNDSKKDASEKFINWIEDLNNHFSIPNYIEALKPSDIDELSTFADKEANPLYPVPKLFDKNELSKIYKKALKKQIRFCKVQ